jgi:hypothetical protein
MSSKTSATAEPPEHENTGRPPNQPRISLVAPTTNHPVDVFPHFFVGAYLPSACWKVLNSDRAGWQETNSAARPF